MQLQGATELEQRLYEMCRRSDGELPASELATSIVAAMSEAGNELQRLRNELQVVRSRLGGVREKLKGIVCTGGVDAGVVLLPSTGPCHYDRELKCQVYDHQFFSPLGDALIDLYKLAGGTVE